MGRVSLFWVAGKGAAWPTTPTVGGGGEAAGQGLDPGPGQGPRAKGQGRKFPKITVALQLPEE